MVLSDISQLPTIRSSYAIYRPAHRILVAGAFQIIWTDGDAIILLPVAGPKEQSVRPPAVAGLFYPADPQECRRQARGFVHDTGQLSASSDRLWGAIVPHAGWMCSGDIAGEAIGTLASRAPADVVVVFGAVHTPISADFAALDAHQRWQVPGEASDVADGLERALEQHDRLFRVDVRFHAHEHAVEVELPLIQAAWPNARLLPIEVPPVDDAIEIGQRAAAAALDSTGGKVVFLASSDLTHYGPAYGFTPAGVGEAALRWARENDCRLLDLVKDLAAERIVPEVRMHQNACGGGAIAAMLAASRLAGAKAGWTLRHANSVETLAAVAPQPPIDAVGYAAVVVG